MQAEADRKAAAHQAAIDRTLEQKQKRDADLVAKIEREKQEAVGILFFFHFFLLSGGWLNRFCSLLVMWFSQEEKVNRVLAEKEAAFRAERDRINTEMQQRQEAYAKQQAEMKAKMDTDRKAAEQKRNEILAAQKSEREAHAAKRKAERDAAIASALARNDQQEADRIRAIQQREQADVC